VPSIVPIVEGEGEVASVPILVRRIAHELGVFDVRVSRPIRTSRDAFPRISSERELRVGQARIEAGGDGGILVIFDSDGEPPCTNRRHRLTPCVLGGELLAIITLLAAGRPITVVMAEHEYEAWFLAAAASLIGEKGLVDGIEAPEHPDLVRDAKGWLSMRMRDAPKYEPTADQARFTERFDMALARERSPSFNRAYEEIARLVQAVSRRQEIP
jgi:hypothetical protein